MRQYLDLLRDALENGTPIADRTGVGTYALFGRQSRYVLSPDFPGARERELATGERAGFPLVTTKKLHVRSIVYELLWFLRGETNVRWLQERGVSIWDEWADPETGELGPVYGAQWRSWASPDGGSVDQIAGLIAGLRERPFSRRHVVTAWNPSEVGQMALPPCHCLFQFQVTPASDDGPAWLSCLLYQRSGDLFLGVPFNIASYALLTHMVASVAGMRAGEFIHTLGDAHLYANHVDQAREQLSREPRALPRLELRPRASIFDFAYEDIAIVGYEPHGRIPAPVAV